MCKFERKKEEEEEEGKRKTMRAKTVKKRTNKLFEFGLFLLWKTDSVEPARRVPRHGPKKENGERNKKDWKGNLKKKNKLKVYKVLRLRYSVKGFKFEVSSFEVECVSVIMVSTSARDVMQC